MLTKLVFSRPSPFVLSADGESTQKRLWRETLAVLQSVVPGMNIKEGLAGEQ